MEKTIFYKNTPVNFRSEGEGTPIVLLHGYLESMHIWDYFADELKHFYRVISVDLPGHGQSGIIDSTHTMELMADAVLEIADFLSLDKFIPVGHSMGGYVTLAIAEKAMERLSGFCLFHSTPFADSEEKKENRDREIELVKQGKKELIVNINIPKAFANDNLERFEAEIIRAKEIAINTPEKGIIAALRGMKLRPDRTSIVKESPVPVLWITGKNDNYIDYNYIQSKANLLKNGKLLTIENVGHMGFIEEPMFSLKAILSFFRYASEP
jgi:pimeloyl-ACP methyl ester carboxylesterase